MLSLNSSRKEDQDLFEGVVTSITTPTGQIIQAEARAVIGYSLGRHYRIEPGETLFGFVPYSLFGDPGEIKELPNKQLNHAVSPTVCR